MSLPVFFALPRRFRAVTALCLSKVCAPLALLISFLFLSLPAYAGQWVVTYEVQGNSTGEDRNGDGTRVTNKPWRNEAVNQYLSLDMSSPPYSDDIDDIHAEGDVTAVFTWSGGPGDDPPAFLYVTETASASAGGPLCDASTPFFTLPLVLADDGLMDAPLSPFGPLSVVCSGSHTLQLPTQGQRVVRLPKRHLAASILFYKYTSSSPGTHEDWEIGMDPLDGGYEEIQVSYSALPADVSLLTNINHVIKTGTDSNGNQLIDAYAALRWKLKEDDSPSDPFYDGFGIYIATAQVSGHDIYNPQSYNWSVKGTPFAQYNATEGDPNIENNLDYLLPDKPISLKHFHMDLGKDPILLPQTTSVGAVATGPNTSDSDIAVGKTDVTWHLPWENATPGPEPAISRPPGASVRMADGSLRDAGQVGVGSLISMDDSTPVDRDHAWEVTYVWTFFDGSHLLYLDHPLPVTPDAEQALIDSQIAQITQADVNVLRVGKAGVQFGLEGYVQLAQFYAEGPFYEFGAEKLLAAGYKVADVLQMVAKARADVGRLRAASELSATLITRLKARQAAGNLTAEETAQMEAALPQLERGQKDLDAGIEHLNSYVDQADQVARETGDGVEAVGGGATDVGLPGNVSPGAPGSPEHKATRWQEYQANKPNGWSYDRWSKVYDLNMTRASNANIAADAYGQTLGWGIARQTININGEVRVLDWADQATKRGIEYKTGYIHRNPEIDYELKRDAALVKQQGWSVTWVFQGTASKPLQEALEAAGIKVIFR